MDVLYDPQQRVYRLVIFPAELEPLIWYGVLPEPTDNVVLLRSFSLPVLFQSHRIGPIRGAVITPPDTIDPEVLADQWAFIHIDIQDTLRRVRSEQSIYSIAGSR